METTIEGAMQLRTLKVLRQDEDIKLDVTKIAEELERKDSIEIGAPSKGGVIKIYLNFGDVESCKERIKKALEVREYANKTLNGELPQ